MTTAESPMTTNANAKDFDAKAAVPLKRKTAMRPYLILGGVVAFVLLAYFAFRALTAGKEETDDAQVSADMVPISARVGGMVIDVPVMDNQDVLKGTLLAQIDPADYTNKVKEAQAELAAANAQANAADAQMQIAAASSKGGLGVARAALSGTTSSVAGADAQIQVAHAMVAKAQADSQKADNDLVRAQSLRKDDAIPQAQVDSFTSTAAASHAAVAQAQGQLSAAEDMKTTAQTRIAEAQGRVEQSAPVDAQLAAAKANADLAHARAAAAQVAVDQAQLNLSYTKIVAAADGHISKLAVHTGQLVQVSQVITNMLPSSTYVIANFKETQVGDMKIGQAANVSIDAFPGRTFHGKVDSLAYGTGAQFSLLPPDNASGNFVKVVQRVPVKIIWTDLPKDVHLQAGLSTDVTVITK